MSAAGKAVFLSYASQDAEAARRICDALRAAGIEVWFDQSELRGGDTWDQKIRKQIRDCTLFLPLISASTQARREGYFRLEWKLADDRTHLMAKGTPFLVPVCVDDTKDWDALVPDSFMTVQWTRLPRGETPPKFAERLAQLLAGDTTPPMPVRAPAPRAESPTAQPVGRRVPAAAWGILAAAVVLGLVALFALRPAPDAGAGPRPPAAGTSTAAWPRDPDLKRAHKLIYTLDSIPEDYALAEDIVKPLLAARPNDPEVVTVAAEVSQELVSRGFDTSQARRALTQRLTERAVQLAPDSPEALGTLGRYLLFINAQLGRAEELLRRAIELDPKQARYHRSLYYVLFLTKPAAEADAFGARMAALFPHDPLVAYDIARRHKDANELALAEEWFDRTLALASVGFAMTWKAWFLLQVHGDVAGMKAVLDRIPERQRTNARVVNAFAVHAGITRETATALNLLNAVGETWMTDFDFTGPKALLAGDLLRLDGRDDLARLQYETALAEIRRKQEADPTDIRLRRAEVWVQLGLGHRDEARAVLRIVSQSLLRPARWGMRNSWWSGTIRACLLLDERAQAVALLKESCEEPQGRLLLRNMFRLDPKMAPFRDDPEIAALLAEPAARRPEDGGQKAAAASPQTEAAKLAARAVALYSKSNYTREDLATAEELARKATELEPDSAAAWGARAGVHSTYFYRNWDVSEKRRLDLQTTAARALGLNPDEPEALLAQGRLLGRQGPSVAPQAEATLRRAVAARPDDNRFARALSFFYTVAGRVDEQRAVLRAAVQRDPRDAIARYDLAMSFAHYSSPGDSAADFMTAVGHIDAGIAVQPVASLLLLKAVLTGGWRGDLPAMRAQLDLLEKQPHAERAEDRAVFVAMWGALLERQPGRVAAAGALTAKNYFEDTVVPRRPKDWALALAHRLEGKENLARLDWRKAEAVLRQRLRDDPGSQILTVELATTLAGLDRTDEAARELAPIEAAWREELNNQRARGLANYYGLIGDAAKAAPYLRRSLNATVFMSTHALRLDPWFDKLRGQPEFEALLKEPAGKE